jgi:hypothetical protein
MCRWLNVNRSDAQAVASGRCNENKIFDRRDSLRIFQLRTVGGLRNQRSIYVVLSECVSNRGVL